MGTADPITSALLPRGMISIIPGKGTWGKNASKDAQNASVKSGWEEEPCHPWWGGQHREEPSAPKNLLESRKG